MSKFFEWLNDNRKPIGYTVGALNLLAAANYALQGQTGMSIVWSVIGFFLIWDAYELK